MRRKTGIIHRSVLFVLLSVSSMTFAQESNRVTVGDCDLGSIGLNDQRLLVRFDKELRDALKNHDASKLAMLLEYPLRVNSTRGTILIVDASSFQGHFDEVFTPAIRQQLLTTTVKDIWCKYTGIAYKGGLIWLSSSNERIRVRSINQPDDRKKVPTDTVGTIKFACLSKSHRSIVDIGLNGTLRLRVWNEPNSLLSKPDLEFEDGKENWAGTDPCVETSWTFSSGDSEFSLSTRGCTDDSTPKEATGSIDIVSKGNTESQNEWCF